MAGRLATGNKNRTGLVQRQYRLDIPNIEGAFEKEVSWLQLSWSNSKVNCQCCLRAGLRGAVAM